MAGRVRRFRARASAHLCRPAGRGVSPVIAAVILMVVVIAVGAGVWSYTNSAVGAALAEQAGRAALNINQLNEKVLIFHINATTNGAPADVTIWFFNTGAFDANITTVLIWENESRTKLQSFELAKLNITLTIPKGDVGMLTLPYTAAPDAFVLGRTYFVQVVTQFGNTFTYSQRLGP